MQTIASWIPLSHSSWLKYYFEVLFLSLLVTQLIKSISAGLVFFKIKAFAFKYWCSKFWFRSHHWTISTFKRVSSLICPLVVNEPLHLIFCEQFDLLLGADQSTSRWTWLAAPVWICCLQSFCQILCRKEHTAFLCFRVIQGKMKCVDLQVQGYFEISLILVCGFASFF